MNFSGVYVATVTAFNKNGEFDPKAYADHVERLIAAGIHGLVPCGTTGESPTLTRQERRQMIQICKERSSGRGVSVVVGCGGNVTSAVAELIADAESLDVDGTLVVTPYYNRPTQAGLVAHYLHLADRCKRPLLLYHVPGRTHVPLALETVDRLFEHPQIAGIKEASGQHAYWQSLSAIAKRRERCVLAGDDDAFAVIQAYGGHGIISASANLIPDAYVRIYEQMQSGHWEIAFREQLRIAPLVRALFSETSPAPLKYLLSRVQPIENVLRLPLVAVSKTGEQVLDREWACYQEGNNG